MDPKGSKTCDAQRMSLKRNNHFEPLRRYLCMPMQRAGVYHRWIFVSSFSQDGHFLRTEVEPAGLAMLALCLSTCCGARFHLALDEAEVLLPDCAPCDCCPLPPPDLASALPASDDIRIAPPRAAAATIRRDACCAIKASGAEQGEIRGPTLTEKPVAIYEQRAPEGNSGVGTLAFARRRPHLSLTLALLRSLVISASISDRPEAGEIFLPTVDYHDPSWN